ncbi:MAG: DUF4863 family protein [Planctomycetes bacterium]|nr:DUF4863 family protein [Planctomycetota bacterium]MCB9872520.1 DUF4863 family protein [Planctomycetota bacterium]
MTSDDLLALLDPLTAALHGLDLSDPQSAQNELQRRFPVEGEAIQEIRAAMAAGVDAGWLVPREKGPVKFGRLAKEQNGFSLDVVLSGGPGPRHLHPNGEINLMFVWEGAPIFDGCAPGWAVFAPGTVHVPEVAGGRMLILYLLPEGAVEWV